MLSHVKRVMIVSRSHIIPPLVIGQNSAVEVAWVEKEPQASLLGSLIPALCGSVVITMLLEYQSFSCEAFFLSANDC